MSITENKTRKLSDVQEGKTFTVAGMEFIKFPEVYGQVPVVMKEPAFTSEFGNNNDLRCSDVLRKMEKEILPKIVDAVGQENICTIQTDLTTLDGLKNYGIMESLVSLPTLDFYRAHAEIFNQYKPDSWWWLATADSTQPNDNPWWTVCVSPAGCIGHVYYYGGLIGVRPFFIFHSSIFVS